MTEEKKDAEGPQPGEPYKYNFEPFSVNNRIIVEPYQTDRTLKSVERNGFAMISQKVSMKGLTVLIEANIQDGSKYTQRRIPKGSKVYIKEELLHSQPWAKQIYENDVVGGKFIIVDMQYVEFIGP